MIRSIVQKILSKRGYALVQLKIKERNSKNPEFLMLSRWVDSEKRHEISPLSEYILQNFSKSRSQLQQDLVAGFLARNHQISPKTKMYFLEFGATNGVSLSNTYFLENSENWSGLLAEPAHVWHSELTLNRKCGIDFRAVYRNSGERVIFSEVDLAELSTISRFAGSDIHRNSRKNVRQYEVETISLEDLLIEHDAPLAIDYLSIDTEGSELEILSEFDFTKWQIGFLTVEITSKEKQLQLDSILTPHGFRRVLAKYSEWEAWYVNPDVYNFSDPID
jgi:FkbM family methyltransferase